MSVSNFIPAIWANEVQTELSKNLVYAGLCNRDYEGEISNFGDTVKINQIADPVIGTYTKYTDITFNKLSDAQTELKIDQAKYFTIAIDDIDEAQTKPKLMATAAQRAAYGLGDTLDQYIAALYAYAGVSGVGTSGSPIDVTSANVDEFFLLAGKVMSDAKIPKMGRVAVIPPWITEKIALAGISLRTDNLDYFDNSFMGTSYVGRAFGFDMFESQNVSVATAATGAGTRVMCFTREAITLAEQIVKVEAIRPEKQFGDVLKGLHVYGAKVVRPDMLLTAFADYTAEA